MNLAPGRYSCIVTPPGNGWMFEAGENNSPYVKIPLRITSGPMKGEEVSFSAWLTDKAYERTMKNLSEVFGWDQDLEKLASEVRTGHFVGKECSIVCEEEMGRNGKTYVKIAWLNGPEGGGKLMDANRALQLARRLKGLPPGEDTHSGALVEHAKPFSRPQGPDDTDEDPFDDGFPRDAEGNIPF